MIGSMETPPLNALLEEDKVSALLANFAQLYAEPFRVWLVEAEGNLVGCHPLAAQDVDEQDLLAAFDHVRQFGRFTSVPIGLATPIWLRGRIVGALIVAVPDGFDPHRAAALQLIGRVISLLAENSLTREDLLSETLDRYRELNLLYRSGEIIAASLDLSHVNRLVLDESTRLAQADEGAVMLVDRETGQLTVWASYGLDAIQDIGSGIPMGHELAEIVMDSGRTEILERPDPGDRKKPLGAALCVPLKTKDEVLGVISLVHTDPERTFRDNDINLINALAGQAAVAIDNARMFSDLTALHAELEAANRRLRESDKIKSSFLGVITHELRSPFADIDFCLQLIERYGTEAWSQPQREQWDQLIQGVQEAKRMVDNLISFARLLRTQGDLYLTDVDFPQLVTEVTETLKPVMRTRRLELAVVGVETIPLIKADERRLGEAIYHLVHNAIKFNHPGGKIHVRYLTDDGGVRLEVQDTGVGIPADKIKLLWDPFSQAADPLKRGREGLGLGLALVKYVIHAHGGRVGVSSKEGVGSLFRIWLPIAGPEEPISRVNRRRDSGANPQVHRELQSEKSF
jgi:signal transduction histidine kinase